MVPAQVPANDNTNEEVIYSSQKTYMVVCTDPTEDERGFKKYHTLQLVRVEDDVLISQASNITTWCGYFIRWAPSENILSFVNQDPATNKNGNHRLDIYAWKTNGTKPYRIGLGIGSDDPGSWSPDSTRLAVEFQDLSINDPEDETYMILYIDGRPPKKTKARLGVRAMPGVSWLTNNIIYESNTFGAAFSSTEYYSAETGEPLEDLTWWDLDALYAGFLGAQNPLLSADRRWFVIDKTNQEFDDPTQPFDFTYVLYDLQARQSYILSQSEEIVLEFVGWGSDSAFYLVRRPLNNSIPAQPDAPFGLLALDPVTRQMRLVNGQIRYAWLAPDQTHILGANREGDQLLTAIYTLDGQPITATIKRPLPEAVTVPGIPKLQSIWEIPGDHGLVNWAWSHDQKRVALLGSELWLMDLEGNVQKLAENLAYPVYSLYNYSDTSQNNTTAMFWSPQDDYLVVNSGAQVWLVELE